MEPKTRGQVSLNGEIDGLCERLKPMLQSDTKRLRHFLSRLVERHELPPSDGRGIDWREVSARSKIAYWRIIDLKEEIRPIIVSISDALIYKFTPVSDIAIPSDESLSVSKVADSLILISGAFAAKPYRLLHSEAPASTHAISDNRDIDKRTEKLPEFANFPEALRYHLIRSGDRPVDLHRALVSSGDELDYSTINNWLADGRTPKLSEIRRITLRRIAHRYKLPDDYFISIAWPDDTRSMGLNSFPDWQRKFIEWHVPFDFNARPAAEQSEIIEWLKNYPLAESIEYRRFMSKATKIKYGMRFAQLHRGPSRTNSEAPRELAEEMDNLVRFKTDLLSDVERGRTWNEETAKSAAIHLGQFFGALSSGANDPAEGLGLDGDQLTFGLFLFTTVWDWYLKWRFNRTGVYTKTEVTLLGLALGLFRPKTGWVRHNRQILGRVKPVEGLIGVHDIQQAKAKWIATCNKVYRYLQRRLKEVKEAAQVHRDPFEPIIPILEAESPVGEYRKITFEIVKHLTTEMRGGVAYAEGVRSFLMLRIGIHSAVRQKNLRQLLVCPRGQVPRSELELKILKRGELRWNERNQVWEVYIPLSAFKNKDSRFFEKTDFRLSLPDIDNLYSFVDDYVQFHRAILLGAANDPGTLFIKTVTTGSPKPEYNQQSFYQAWRAIIIRYGIYNPYTKRGAIAHLKPHGPHTVRDIVATHILKATGSYEQASYAIQDTPETVKLHYARFLPHDKSAIAARVINAAWV